MGLPVCVPLSLFHTFPSFVATATENLQMLGADAFSALKGTFVCYKCTNLEKVAMVSAFDFALQWYLPWILHLESNDGLYWPCTIALGWPCTIALGD